LPAEYAKGETIFISEDANVVNEFVDQDGNKKMIQYVVQTADGNEKGHAMLMLSPANEQELAKATEKGIFDAKAKSFKFKEIGLEMEDDVSSLQVDFEGKGKLIVAIFDKQMNKVWSEDYGKVSEHWSAELPSLIQKKSGTYYLKFLLGKKVKLYKLTVIR